MKKALSYIIIFFWAEAVLFGQMPVVDNDLNFVLNKIATHYPPCIDVNTAKKSRQKLNNLDRNATDTFAAISKMLLTFNDKHLRMFEYRYYKKLDTLHSKERLFQCEQYLNAEKKIPSDKCTGLWINDYKTAVVCILQSKHDKTIYEAIVYNSRRKNRLTPGTISFTLQKKGSMYITDYTDPQWGARTFFYSRVVDDSILITGAYGKWKKLRSPVSTLDNFPDFDFGPSLKVINSDNILLTIPEFESYNIVKVDSLLQLNQEAILRTKNLIIDIRYNLGGTVRVYKPLFPYVYTNPIIRQGGYIYPTDDLINNRKKTIERRIKTGDTSVLGKLRWELSQMVVNNSKRFFSPGDTIHFDTIHKYPQNIAIIVNYACQSAAEVMVLDFKQSSKVKIFGENTAGAVDYLDLYEFNTPGNKYLLNIPSVRRVDQKNNKLLDNTGIKPDIVINDAVSDWVNWVIQYYEKN